jgi:hypothetical protein
MGPKGRLEITVAPKDRSQTTRWWSFLSWVRELWPSNRGTPTTRVRDGVEKALDAGDALLDKPKIVNDKARAEAIAALQQARLNHTQAALNGAAIHVDLSERQARAALTWAQVADTQASALLKVAEGLRILKELGLDVAEHRQIGCTLDVVLERIDDASRGPKKAERSFFAGEPASPNLTARMEDEPATAGPGDVTALTDVFADHESDSARAGSVLIGSQPDSLGDKETEEGD